VPQTFLLPVLILIPIFAYRFANRKFPHHVFGITGAAFGAIVSPMSMGLYSLFFFSPIGLIPGIVGLVLITIHEPPGFHLVIRFGLDQGAEVASSPTLQLIIEAINAVIWSAFYGLIGFVADYIEQD
jgi:hypothetical protein